MEDGSFPSRCQVCRVLIMARHPMRNTFGWMILIQVSDDMHKGVMTHTIQGMNQELMFDAITIMAVKALSHGSVHDQYIDCGTRLTRLYRESVTRAT